MQRIVMKNVRRMNGHGCVADQMEKLDWTVDTSPVQSWFSKWPCVANVVAEAKVHVSMRFVGSFCGFCKQLRPIKRALFPTTFLEIAVYKYC